MHPFKNEVEQILVILKNAQADIKAIDNPAMAALTNRVLTDINRNINFLSMQIGASVDNHITQPPATRPLRSFLGAPIVRKEDVAVLEIESEEEDIDQDLDVDVNVDDVDDVDVDVDVDVDDVDDVDQGKDQDQALGQDVTKALKLTPEDVAFNELKATLDKLYPIFTDLEDAVILDTYSDLEIRSVGKKAGLPITETHPKKMDAKQIGIIKAAIKKKAQIESENPE